ncbi:hypothetical protein QN239_31195 [Mycolicibacterium sp. Y3]
MILFPHDGLLAILEVHYWVQPRPGLPSLDMIEWHRDTGPWTRSGTRAENAKTALTLPS